MSVPCLLVDVAGTGLDAGDRDLLRQPLVAGVTLFARNFASRGQLQDLCAELHALRDDRRLLIAVDQEGGRVQRFRDGFTALPPAAELGRRHRQDGAAALALAADVGHVMAAELRAVGVDLCFAPVLDVASVASAVIGDRALSADAASVGALARALAEGMLRGGLPAVGKHFPGHGGVAGDSHTELPHDTRSLDGLRRVDLQPYRQLMDAPGEPGVGLLAGVMTAHVVFDTVDERPATFSSRWLRDELRERLGYRGVVFSDDLAMAGASHAGDAPARVRGAFAAGCDVALLCNDRAAVLDVLASFDDDPAPLPDAARVRALVGRVRSLPSAAAGDASRRLRAALG